MNKIILILKREYLTRVKKRAFLLTTILFPVLYMLLIFGTSYLGATTKAKLKVIIVDQSGYFTDSILRNSNASDSSVVFYSTMDKAIQNNYRNAGYDGYVIMPVLTWQDPGAKKIKFITDKTHGLGTTSMIESKLNGIWTETLNEKLGIDQGKKALLNSSRISVSEENQQNKNADSIVASTIGYACGFLIYFILLIYGSQVMMGVMEEKTNRIAEVIISSVKPFQLMLG